MEIDDPGDMTLDLFSMWRVDSLKLFLEKRGLSKEGTKCELAALCFAANKMNIPVKLTCEEIVVVNKQKYKDLLVISSTETIPDPFELCDGWFGEKDGLCQWPPIYLSDLTKFFVVTTEDPNAEEYLNSYKKGKAYEYFTSNWMKEVFFHPISANSKYCLFRSQCTPSQRVSDTDHGVWACAEKKSGSIMCAYCSCTAGLGQTCNHVAAMLFRIEHANRMGLSNGPCTSLPCSWTVPGEKVQYGPQRISNMLPKKSKHGKLASSRPLVSAKKALFEPIPQPEPQQNPLESLGEALKDILPKACLFKGYAPKVSSTKVNSTEVSSTSVSKKDQTERHHVDDGCNFTVKEERYLVCEHAKKFKKGEEEAFFTSLPRLEEKEILAVSKATGQQSLSSLWHTVRKGRITASRFYAVHTKMNTIKKAAVAPDTTSLLKVLKGESGLSDDPAQLPRALKHGLELEPTAKEAFVKENRQQHQNLNVESCGFFIHPSKSFLGASPDMLSSCSCCGKGVVEIKCPVIPPCHVCLTKICSCTGKSLKYLEYANGKFTLKQNHAYYGQIQGQMAVTGRKFCDFYIFTHYATHQERVYFNDLYWENMSSNLESFYKTYVVPDMLQSSNTDIVHAHDNRDEEDMDTEEMVGHVFFCPLCRQIIKEQENITTFGQRSICCDLCDKWYHFKCIKMSKSALKSMQDWLCPTCISNQNI